MDGEFERTICKIKPLAKSLPRNTDERHHITLWIKKLLAEKSDKTSRNHYAQLLLKSLQKSQLQLPFTASPPPGILPQVNDELDTLLLTSSNSFSGHKWKHSTPLKTQHYKSPRNKIHSSILKSSDSDSSLDETMCTSYPQYESMKDILQFNDDTSEDEEGKFTKLSAASRNSPTSRVVTINAGKLKKPGMASFTPTDSDKIKSFLDHKNSEIESLRKEYTQKSSEMQMKYKQMETNAMQLEQQLLAKKEEHKEELERIKESFQKQLHQSKGNLKRKFQGIVTNIEQEKIELENQQSQTMQSLLDDANGKLSSMNTEVQRLTQTVNILESQNQQLDKQLDIIRQTKDSCMQEKNQLHEQCISLDNSLKTANKKVKYIEKQYAQLKDDKECEINVVKIESDKQLQALKHEMELEQLRAKEEAVSLQNEIQKLQNTLKEVNTNHRQKIMELESSAWKQVQDKETELNTLRNSIEKKDFESMETLSNLKESLHNKEVKIKELKAQCDALRRQLDDAIKDGKSELERTQKEHQTIMQKVQDKKEHRNATIKSLEKTISDLTEKLDEQTKQLETEYHERQLQEATRLTEKHAIQLQHLQHDHEVNMALANENITSLKLQIKNLQEEQERSVAAHVEEMKELTQTMEHEMNELKAQTKEMETTHSQALANEKATSDELEKRLHKLQQNYESQLSELQTNSIDQRQIVLTKQEYEDAIHSLKQEVHILTQRADVLQKQLAQFRTCSTLRKHIKSSHKKH